MPITLEIRTGTSAGQRIQLTPGQRATVGRLDKADMVVQDDPMLSNLHFALECGPDACVLKDLGSRFGTLVNGNKVERAVLCDGDQVIAGKTQFVLRLVADAVTAAPEEPAKAAEPVVSEVPSARQAATGQRHARVLDLLRQQPDPLFALLDAARTPRILELVREPGAEAQSLYEGLQGEVLARFGPYLVRLDKSLPLLQTLVGEGWGNSWGVYLTTGESFKDLRKHFRHFLLMKTEEGSELYFRFYDPRVLRVFLPTCTPEEVRAFFGRVASFLLESKDGEQLLRFTAGPQSVLQEAATLTEPTSKGRAMLATSR